MYYKNTDSIIKIPIVLKGIGQYLFVANTMQPLKVMTV